MSVVTRKLFRLAAKWWPKEQDMIFDMSPRTTSADLHWLAGVFSKEFTDELIKRGYDLNTLRFHVDKTPAAIDAHFRMHPDSAYRPLYERQQKRAKP